MNENRSQLVNDDISKDRGKRKSERNLFLYSSAASDLENCILFGF